MSLHTRQAFEWMSAAILACRMRRAAACPASFQGETSPQIAAIGAAKKSLAAPANAHVAVLKLISK
jgi:hypothetical protein